MERTSSDDQSRVMDIVCAHCGRPSEALRRCTGCLGIWYCSRDCQKRHWSRHKVTCSVQTSRPSSSSPGQHKKKRGKSKNGRKNKKTSQGQVVTSVPEEKDVGKKAQSAPPADDSAGLPVCKTCKTKIGTAVKCERCKEVTYCSRDCRRADWMKHMDTCTPLDSKAQNQEQAERSVVASRESEESTRTAQSSELLPLGACGKDQTRDKDQSRDADSDASRRPQLSEEEDKNLEMCQKCQSKGKNMKKCGRCLEVTYCSRDCQKVDWVSHKVTCQAIEVLTTDGYRETERREQAAKRQQEVATNFLARLLSQNRRSVMPPPQRRVSWAEAKCMAAATFLCHQIVDDFDELDSDTEFYFPFLMRGAGMVALGRLTTVYYHPFRHARKVEDVNGTSVYVIFYSTDSPFQHFDYSLLKEGNYICIQEAFLHVFADGSIGFRIDDTDDVRIIESRP
ncbi:hypothetical protein ACOMHN_047510 [Nucella lapillus]